PTLLEKLGDFKDWTLEVGLPAAGTVVEGFAGWIGDRLADAKITLANFKDWALEVGLPTAGAALAGLGDWIGERLADAKIILADFTDWTLEVGVPAVGEGLTIAADFAVNLVKGVADLARQIWASPNAATLAEAEKLGADIGKGLGQFLARGINAALGNLTGPGGFLAEPQSTLDRVLSEGPGLELDGDHINLGTVFHGFDREFSAALQGELEPVFDEAYRLLGEWARRKITEKW